MIPPKLILASSSLGRLELLESVKIIPNEVISPDINEEPIKNERPSQYVKRLSLQKAQEVFSRVEDVKAIILAADTVIVKGHTILGKPKDEEQARSFLKLLSGKKHKVLTAYTVIATLQNNSNIQHNLSDKNIKKQQFLNNKDVIKVITKMVKTNVTVKRLLQNEIDFYIKCNQWQGKAGGYAIQGCFQSFVKQINGSVSSVVGLPLCEVVSTLRGLGYVF